VVFGKQYLMTAGPTPLPPAVSQVMAEPILYHRAPAFIEIYARVLERLKAVYQTRNEVLTFASSGTGAMESAVANLIAPGDVAVVASSGKFGERWAELCDAYGAETVHLETEWGDKIDPAQVDEALASAGGRAKAFFTTQSETSTGVVNDVQALTEVAHAHGAVIAVDAVSGLGVVDLPTDEWDVDVVVSGSQKALMCPPGLAFASVSERALGVATPNRTGFPLVLVPLADPEDLDRVGHALLDRGIYPTLAPYPGVPRSEVGFRIQVTAANTDEEIDSLLLTLDHVRGALRQSI